MSVEHPASPDSVRLALARQVDEVCLRFEAAWQAGQRPAIEDYLANAQEPLRSDLLRELVKLDIEYRRTKAREGPSPRDYRDCFPDLDPEWLAGAAGGSAASTTEHSESAATLATPLANGKDPVAASPPSVKGYEILGELGRGGMGVVYKAWQVRLKRVVALKMILPANSADQEALARFRTEAEAVARLEHPQIVHIHEVGTDQGRAFCSFEFVDGESLAQKLAGTPLPARRAAELVEVLARAMHYAHQRGIVHRDLTPGNVLLTAGGTPKITDFGLAKILVGGGTVHTQTGDILGTPSYMAPEQAVGKGQEVSPAIDVYALGAILYETLTGRPPFRAATPLDTMMQVVSEEPIAPRRLQSLVPRDLETICLKCLEKEPGKRYGSAAALADDCAAFLRGEPITARPVGPAGRLWRWAQRNPAVAGLVTALVLVFVAGLVGVVSLLVLAVQRGNLAEANFKAADEQKRRAEKENERFRHTLYASQTHLIQQVWQDDDITRVLELLNGEGCRPTEPGQTDLRDWEWFYLRGLCHTDLRTLKTEADELSDVVFSPDGKQLAAAGWGSKAVYLWDTDTWSLRHVLRGHENVVSRVAFRPDGKQLASASRDGTVRLWDPASGKETRTFQIANNWVNSVAFSPDGRQLAIGHDAVITLRQTEGEEKTRTLGRHPPNVTSIAFSPRGDQLASAGLDGTAMLWDVTGGKPPVTFRGHTRQLSAVAFSADGKTLATGSEDNTVKLWDVASGQVRFTLRGHTAWAGRVAFSPNGRQVASAGYDGLVKLWDAGTGREIRTFRGHTTNYVNGVSFSPDGRRLASCALGIDGTVKLWDLTTPSQEYRTLAGHPEPVIRVVFSPDGKRLASASRDGTARVWDVASGRTIHTLTGHTKEVWCVAFSPDGKQVASASDDATVKLWDAAEGREIRTFRGHRGIVRAVGFSPDGKLLASGSGDATVRFWDVATGTQILSLIGHTGEVKGVGFSPDGRQLASVGADGRVKIWEVPSGRLLHTFEGHAGQVWPVAFSPDGRQLVSGDDRGLIKFWDSTSGQEIRTVKGHVGLVLGLAFSPGGRLASAGADHTVKLWDATSGQEVLTLKASDTLVYTVAFSPDGRWLASAGSAVEIKLWDGARGDER
jgi:WD40 repeat protein